MNRCGVLGLTRRSLFAALVASLVALVRPRKTTTLSAAPPGSPTTIIVSSMPLGDPQILSSWTDPSTGDLIVLALFPGQGKPDDHGRVKLTEVRFKNKVDL